MVWKVLGTNGGLTKFCIISGFGGQVVGGKTNKKMSKPKNLTPPAATHGFIEITGNRQMECRSVFLHTFVSAHHC